MAISLQYDACEQKQSFDLLERLASFTEQSDDVARKRELLWDLTEFFLESAEACDEGDRTFFGDLMEELAFSLERQVREDLARKIASESEMPHKLIWRLANDEIPVARPVLEQSPVLSEDDLIDISTRHGQEHLLAITKRRELSKRLSAVLAERGNQDVVESLIINPRAELSPDTIDLLAGRSRVCERIQSALVLRKDIPREIFLDVLKHASEKVRRDIKRELTSRDEAKLDEVVDSLRFEINVSNKSAARESIEALEKRNALNEAAVVGFLREKKPMEFLLALASLLGSNLKFAEKMLNDQTGQMLVVGCRACAISFGGLKEIISSPMTAISANPRTLLDISKNFHRMSVSDAQEMLRALKLRNNMNAA